MMRAFGAAPLVDPRLSFAVPPALGAQAASHTLASLLGALVGISGSLANLALLPVRTALHVVSGRGAGREMASPTFPPPLLSDRSDASSAGEEAEAEEEVLARPSVAVAAVARRARRARRDGPPSLLSEASGEDDSGSEEGGGPPALEDESGSEEDEETLAPPRAEARRPHRARGGPPALVDLSASDGGEEEEEEEEYTDEDEDEFEDDSELDADPDAPSYRPRSPDHAHVHPLFASLAGGPPRLMADHAGLPESILAQLMPGGHASGPMAAGLAAAFQEAMGGDMGMDGGVAEVAQIPPAEVIAKQSATVAAQAARAKRVDEDALALLNGGSLWAGYGQQVQASSAEVRQHLGDSGFVRKLLLSLPPVEGKQVDPADATLQRQLTTLRGLPAFGTAA